MQCYKTLLKSEMISVNPVIKCRVGLSCSVATEQCIFPHIFSQLCFSFQFLFYFYLNPPIPIATFSAWWVGFIHVSVALREVQMRKKGADLSGCLRQIDVNSAS